MADISRRRFGGLAMAAATATLGMSSAWAATDCKIATPQGYETISARLATWTDAKQPVSLAGQIWAHGKLLGAQTDAKNGCSYPALLSLHSELSDTLWNGGLVLLGEIHDNAEHHGYRAEFLAMLTSERLKGVVFEQIRADQKAALDAFAARKKGTTDDLLAALDWEHSPWSKTADYRPLFEAAVANGLPIYPGDPPREVIHKAARQGLAAALLPDEITRLALDRPLGEANVAASLKEIEDSHCGMIPKSAHPGMAGAQRYRDAHMADALIRAAGEHGSAILFAGNGHVRTDRGVPWYLRARKPDAKIVSVMLVEVEEGQTDSEAYVPRDAEGKPATDYIVFTPRATRDDPCEKMRAPK